MSVDWGLYERMLGSDCSPIDARVDAIIGSVDSFIDGIVDDPAYQADALVEGEPTPIAASRTASHQCSIAAAPSTDIHIGDMVECLGGRWIIVELYVDKIGLLRGTMWLCNDTVRFQNHSPAVHVRYCVMDNGAYSKRSTDPDAFVMTNTYQMYLSKDSETEKMFVDKRLSFGCIYDSTGNQILEVYKIIGIDSKSKNHGEGSHILVVTLQRDVYNPDADSLDSNLCDICQVTGDVSKPALSGSCIINGKDTIRIGTRRKYTAVFTDSAGDVITDISPVWNVHCDDGDINISEDGIKMTVNSDFTCSIEIPLDSKFVGSTILLTVWASDDREEPLGYFEKKVQVIAVG